MNLQAEEAEGFLALYPCVVPLVIGQHLNVGLVLKGLKFQVPDVQRLDSAMQWIINSIIIERG